MDLAATKGMSWAVAYYFLGTMSVKVIVKRNWNSKVEWINMEVGDK